MDKLFVIGFGGCIGAMLRYLISILSSRYLGGQIPYGTLIVNVLGGILIGVIIEISINTKILSSNMVLFLTTGLLGGLTTFSTFSLETVNLFQTGRYIASCINIFLNLFLSIGGVIIGRYLFIFNRY